ncbi:MAG: hypothetical protein M3R05_07250 [Chloroflexota bacterium]|nr:hypothetical protein [Chloroflexota bacterium]
MGGRSLHPTVRAASGANRILLACIGGACVSIAVNAVITTVLDCRSAAFTQWFLLGIGSLLFATQRRREARE